VIDGGALLSEDDIRGYEMPPERSLDIDTPRDLALAQLLAEQHLG
jgi:CMP-N-acetylneuraminic acid synthetase